MKLHHLRNVIAVVEHGSLRAGAKHLGLAQPAMSRSIRELEEDLGVILFERSMAGMALTKAGEIFVRRARSLEAEFQRTRDAMAQLRGAEQGTVTLACSGSALLAIAPSIVRNFHHRFPNVRLKLIEGTFPVVAADVRDGLIDAYYGPVARMISAPALVIDRLFENKRMIVCRRNHPLQSATSLTELVEASWVTTPIMFDSDNEVNSVFEAAGLHPPRIVVQAASGLAVTAVVATTELLAPLPQQWTEVIRATGLLMRIPIIEVPNAPAFCAVRRADLPLTPAAQHADDLARRAAALHVQTRDTLD